MTRSLFAILVVVLGTSLSSAPGARAADKVKFVPAPEIKWSDVPNMAGVQIAPIDGAPDKGPSHFFLKFTGGFAAPVHHHTANHSGTVVSGTLVLIVDGKEQKLPAGSFFAFSNKTKHATRCEAGADCVLSMDVRGKWDVLVDADKKK
jgi:mannose-6-phosphate isomerase-like protein (cupin superfamily)